MIGRLAFLFAHRSPIAWSEARISCGFRQYHPYMSKAELLAQARPEALRRFDDGTPQPDWVALLHEAREGRR